MQKASRVFVACAALVLLLAGVAHAGDAVKASVGVPASEPVPIITENGNAYSPGTFAVGTIQLFYTVNAMQFPVGDFAAFDLNTGVGTYKANPATVYPATLGIEQIGGTQVLLTPDWSSYQVTSVSWSAKTRVVISITAGASDADGTELVANLRLQANNHLDTVTNVQVHIRLVHPTVCLRLFNFITDESLANDIASTDVNVNTKGKITATNPFGQWSNNLLVVNTCSVPFAFDAGVTLDSWFSTNPSGNPGNAVFTFSTAGAVDPSGFDISAFGAGTAQGQALCLQNMTVEAGETFLATLHIGINKGTSAATLPATGTFGFSGQLYAAGSGCTAAPSFDVLSNPASASVTFTKK